jgi:hypothetical protein
MQKLMQYKFADLGLFAWLLALSFWCGVLYSKVESNAAAITFQRDYEIKIYNELRRINERLSRLEGRLQ